MLLVIQVLIVVTQYTAVLVLMITADVVASNVTVLNWKAVDCLSYI